MSGTLPPTSDEGAVSRTSGERDASRPQARDQTEPSIPNATNTFNSGEAELTVLATARWPGDRAAPRIPGYVLSSFSPLVAEAADRCLRQVYRQPPAPPDAGPSTAVIVVSASGDLTSARHVARTVDSGGRVEPLFFFQCVPNSIAGHIAARWGLGGPVVCLCPTGDPLTDGLDQAALLIEDGDATAAVIVLVEQSAVDGVPATATAVLTTARKLTPSRRR